MTDYSNTILINVADLQDPDDPQGRSYRQVNAARTHSIPLGALVEIVPDEDCPSPSDGARAFVVKHCRDCDMTPLYYIAIDPEQSDAMLKRKWEGGYSEESLRVIRMPGGEG